MSGSPVYVGSMWSNRSLLPSGDQFGKVLHPNRLVRLAIGPPVGLITRMSEGPVHDSANLLLKPRNLPSRDQSAFAASNASGVS
jgi:hypothetical protein